MTWICRFVAAVPTNFAPSPALRLDLNSGSENNQAAGTIQVDADAVDFGMPDMRRSSTSSMLSDGEWVSSSAYGGRTLSIPLLLFGTSAQVAVNLQNLVRELDRKRNYLMVQPDGLPDPVTFRTFRSPITASSIRDVGAGVWRVNLSILAEPYALGKREFSVNSYGHPSTSFPKANTPFTGSAGWNANLNEAFGGTIKGDVPAPLRAMLRLGNNIGQNKAMDDTMLLLHLFPTMEQVGDTTRGYSPILSSVPLGTDTSLAGSVTGALEDSAWAVSFATNAGMAHRLTLTVPGSPMTNWRRGLYRMILRYRISGGAAATTTFPIEIRALPPATAGSQVTISRQVLRFPKVGATTYGQAGDWWYADLGLIHLPLFGGVPDPADDFGDVLPRPSSMRWSVYVERQGPAGTVDLDFFELLPVELVGNSLPAHMAFIRPQSALASGPQTQYGVLGDAETQTARYALETGSGEYAIWGSEVLPVEITGALPKIYPGGYRNQIRLFPTFQPRLGLLNGDVLTDTAMCEFSYYPRYLMLKPVGT